MAEASPSTTVRMVSNQTGSRQFVYFFDGIYLQYGTIDYSALDPNGVPYPPKFLSLGNGQALAAGFSNFANRLYYTKSYLNEEEHFRQLWVSDLPGQEMTLIFTETEQTRIEYLWWSPDDLHRGTWIVDLEANKAIWSFGVWIPDTMRWGPSFDADFSFPD